MRLVPPGLEKLQTRLAAATGKQSCTSGEEALSRDAHGNRKTESPKEEKESALTSASNLAAFL